MLYYVRNKIKEIEKKRDDCSGMDLIYYKGYLEALEWVMKNY